MNVPQRNHRPSHTQAEAFHGSPHFFTCSPRRSVTRPLPISLTSSAVLPPITLSSLNFTFSELVPAPGPLHLLFPLLRVLFSCFSPFPHLHRFPFLFGETCPDRQPKGAPPLALSPSHRVVLQSTVCGLAVPGAASHLLSRPPVTMRVLRMQGPCPCWCPRVPRPWHSAQHRLAEGSEP